MKNLITITLIILITSCAPQNFSSHKSWQDKNGNYVEEYENSIKQFSTFSYVPLLSFMPLKYYENNEIILVLDKKTGEIIEAKSFSNDG